eukprot:Skav209050  [mRNA]  locus=scaffold2483:199785:202611:+ [translate_table: standard]
MDFWVAPISHVDSLKLVAAVVSQNRLRQLSRACGKLVPLEPRSLCSVFPSEPVPYPGKTFRGAVKWTILNHDEEYAKDLDAHFKPMHKFCGGLHSTLHFYDTVEQLDSQSSRQRVEQLMQRIGADPAHIPGHLATPRAEDFFGPLGVELTHQLMEVYKKDYELFHLKPPTWVDRLGQWVPRPDSMQAEYFPQNGQPVNLPYLSDPSAFRPEQRSLISTELKFSCAMEEILR